MAAERSPTYRFVCELARGGMGRVELVVRKDSDFVRLYARKRLLDAFGEDEALRTMFVDEARIAGMLRHPNVVSVLDVGEDDDGMFLVMDYVEGVPLVGLIKAANGRGERMPIAVAVYLTAQACRGLHAAHELVALDGSALHLVHRDVSPQNIMVDRNAHVRVTDFGIAKALGRRSRTSTGLLKGKSGYIAPELLRFEDPDRRADLYSLGVVLYELCTGTRLYRGTDVAQVARRILNEPPPDLGMERPDAPADLVRLAFQLLAKDRDLRPNTALEVAESLEAIARDVEDEELDARAWVAARIEEGPFEERRKLAEVVSKGQGAAASAVDTNPGPTATQTLVRTTIERVWRRRGFLAVTALALVALGALAGVAATSLTSDGPPEVAAPVAEQPSQGAPSPTLTALPPSPEADAQEAMEESPSSAGASSSSVPAAIEASNGPAAAMLPARTKRRRRRNPMRRGPEAAMTSMREDVEVWEW